MRQNAGTDYVNLWFRLEWVRLLAKVLAVVGMVGVFLGWFITTRVFGAEAGQPFLVGCFIVIGVLIVLCAVGAVMQFTRSMFRTPQSPVVVKLHNPEVFVRGPVSRIDAGPHQ